MENVNYSSEGSDRLEITLTCTAHSPRHNCSAQAAIKARLQMSLL